MVLGLLHPLAHLRGSAVQALSAAGVHVDVLGQAGCSADPEAAEACLRACLQANEVRWRMLIQNPAVFALRHRKWRIQLGLPRDRTLLH